MRSSALVGAALVALAASTTASCGAATQRSLRVREAALDPGAPYVPAVQLDLALRDTLAWYRNEWTIPGAAAASFTCDSRRLAWDGVTRVGEATPIGPHSLFPADRHVPSMLATVALRLERRGVLRLDAPLRELWPNAAKRSPWYAHITLGELLSYLPPIPGFRGGDSASRVPQFRAERGQSAAARATAWYLRQRPDSIPSNSRWSDPSYVVAIGILEHVTGQPITQLLRDEVFAPLGVRATFLPHGEYGPNQPRGHLGTDDVLRYPWRPAPTDPPLFFEAGELVVSLPDYVTYLQAHLCAVQGRPTALLTQGEARRIFGSTEPDASTPLGWGTMNDEEPIRVAPSYGHGFASAAGFSGQRDLGAVMFVNVQGRFATYAFRWIWADVFGTEPALPADRSQVLKP